MQQITLDLIPNGSMPVVNASQYDDGRVFRVNITENGTPYMLTDEVIEIHVRKGDGCAVTALVAYTASKSYLDIATTEQMTAVAGNNIAEINVKKNGSDIGSLNFILLVERDPLDAGVDSESVIHDLQAQVDECVQNSFNTLGAAGLPYDNTESGLEATNVQAAIDEVNAKIAEGPSDVYTKEETDALLENKADKSSVYTKTEADALLADKVSTSTLESDYYTKTETDTKLDGKANKSSVYTKTQTDALLDDKVDNSTLEDYYSSSEVDALLYQKANKNSVYTKAEINTQMAGKANVSDLANYYTKSETYSKSQTDDALALKADSADVYDKTYIDNAFTGVNTALGTKADKSTTYTKTETDNALSLKADKSDTYTKAQIDTALSGKVDNATLANYYTKDEVDAKVYATYPSIDVSPAPIASFETDIVLPLKSCKASIVASQASGTPTPSSPLPISGYTGVNLTRCGVNLFDKANVISAYCDYSSRLIYNNDFKSVVVPLKNGVQYLFSQSLLGVFDRFAVCDSLEDNTTIYNPITPNITGLYAGGVPFTFTNSENKKYLICSIWRNTDTYTFDEMASTCQLELGSTASTYTAYNGTTYAVSWQDEAGTVYGGNLDLITGVLTVTHGEIDSYNGESINEPWLSSKDVYTEGGTPTTGAQVVYPLTMPITYQLTPVQVQALLGVNNVFNDTNGDTEVTFRETVQKYVDDKISEL